MGEIYSPVDSGGRGGVTGRGGYVICRTQWVTVQCSLRSLSRTECPWDLQTPHPSHAALRLAPIIHSPRLRPIVPSRRTVELPGPTNPARFDQLSQLCPYLNACPALDEIPVPHPPFRTIRRPCSSLGWRPPKNLRSHVDGPDLARQGLFSPTCVVVHVYLTQQLA